jgi:hypothetical protein
VRRTKKIAFVAARSGTHGCGSPAGVWAAVAAAAPSQPRAHPAGASRHPECAASLSEQISSSSTRI